MRFNVSELGRTVPCYGSKLIESKYPVVQRFEATEGTVAAKIAEDCLITGKPLTDYIGQSVDNIYIDQTMVHYLASYVNHCRRIGEKYPGAVEGKFELEHHGHTLVGKLDYWNYHPDTHTLYVDDLKYGFGLVESKMNWQLLGGAFLIMSHYDWIAAECKTVVLTIIQPRGNHPAGIDRPWQFDADLMRNYANQIKGAMLGAAMENPETKTGPHCKHCRGLLRCHSAETARGLAMDFAGDSYHSEPTAEQLAYDIDVTERAVGMLEQRLTAQKTLGLEMIRKGSLLPGWESRGSMGNLMWSGDAILAGDMLDVDLRKPEVPYTPTQAINMSLLDEKTVKSMSARKPGGLKLKRTSIEYARRILNELQGEQG